MDNIKLNVRHLYKKYEVVSTAKFSFFKKNKNYVQALEDVSFEISSGLYGLLGSNGSGKSTLIGIITGLVEADSGEVLWQGESIKKLGIEYRRILGFMPQQQDFYRSFTGRRFLDYICVLKEIPKKRIQEEIETKAEQVNMLGELERKISYYSGGMKQRLLLAAALIGDPKLLILDEPTAGLDPEERLRLRKILKELSKSRIVLMATHIVSDVETVADKIMILKKGCLIDFDKPENLEKYRI